jgi:hypothetical protein
MASVDRAGAVSSPSCRRGRATAALLAAGLTACAGARLAPPADDARARWMEVPEGLALVYVYRPDAPGGPRTLRLHANSERIGDLPRDSWCLLEVEPGELRLDLPPGDGATPLRMEVEAGHRYFVRHDPAPQATAEDAESRTATLVPVDEDAGRAALGRLLRIVAVRRRASAPSAGEPPPPDRARVVVFRRLWWRAPVRLEVVVNGRTLRSGGARALVVADARLGRVELSVRGDAPARLTLELAPGEEAFVEAVPRDGLFGPRFELRRVTAARGREAVAGLRVAARVEL